VQHIIRHATLYIIHATIILAIRLIRCSYKL